MGGEKLDAVQPDRAFHQMRGAQRLYARLGYRIISQVLARPVTPRPTAVTLKPMTQRAYDVRLADLSERDPYALVRTPDADAAGARRVAAQLAPNGVRTEGLSVCTAYADGREAGWVWYALPNPGRPTIGLISHLEIAPAERRRGLGGATVAAVENALAARGVPKVGLVVPGRPEALGFAGTLGMTLASQQMVKDL